MLCWLPHRPLHARLRENVPGNCQFSLGRVERISKGINVEGIDANRSKLAVQRLCLTLEASLSAKSPLMSHRSSTTTTRNTASTEVQGNGIRFIVVQAKDEQMLQRWYEDLQARVFEDQGMPPAAMMDSIGDQANLPSAKELVSSLVQEVFSLLFLCEFSCCLDICDIPEEEGTF